MTTDKKEMILKSEPIISIKVGECTFKDLGTTALRKIQSSVTKPIEDKKS